MKRFSTSLAFSFAGCVVFHGIGHAQTLTASDQLAPIGNTFTQKDIIDLFPWDTLQGNNVTWDYAWLNVNANDSMIFTSIALSDAPQLADYPGTTRVVRSTSGNGYVVDRYSREGPDILEDLGSVGPTLNYDYDIPMTATGFNMELGDTLHDPDGYCVWSDGGGFQFHFCGGSYVTFDAVGTLILPYGTFQDVKHVTHWRSSTETTQGDPEIIFFTRQQWFAPGLPFPILEMNFADFLDGLYTYNGSLLNAGSTTSIADNATGGSIRLYPNPTTADLVVERDGVGKALLEVIAEDGRVVSSTAIPQGTQRQLVPLAGEPAGIYLVRIVGDGSGSAQRVVKLPVD